MTNWVSLAIETSSSTELDSSTSILFIHHVSPPIASLLSRIVSQLPRRLAYNVQKRSAAVQPLCGCRIHWQTLGKFSQPTRYPSVHLSIRWRTIVNGLKRCWVINGATVSSFRRSDTLLNHVPNVSLGPHRSPRSASQCLEVCPHVRFGSKGGAYRSVLHPGTANSRGAGRSRSR
jgi:hypothetical protein